jgi:hypothetical protein
VGRQDGLDPEAPERDGGRCGLGGEATLGPKRADDSGERVVGTPAGRPASTSPAGREDADAMPFLGQVRQAEVEEERANDDVSGLGLEAVELPFQRPPRCRVTRTGSQRAPARALDEPPEGPAGLLVDDIEDQPPEAVDLGREPIGLRHRAS